MVEASRYGAHHGAEPLLALTTESNMTLAEALARRLLADRLVACVSLQPVRSLYIWEGQLEQGDLVGA